MLDRNAFPLASAYLAGLPKGFDSFPECRVNTESYSDLRKDVPALAEVKLPPEVDACFYQKTKWAPDAVGVTLSLMVRDHLGSDQAFFDWTYENSAAIFRRPTYKVLMFVMSPSLVLLGAAKRWAAFREGTELLPGALEKDSGERTVGNVVLHSPVGLYPDIIVKSFAWAFKAALAATRAREVEIDLIDRRDEKSTYRTSWIG